MYRSFNTASRPPTYVLYMFDHVSLVLDSRHDQHYGYKHKQCLKISADRDNITHERATDERNSVVAKARCRLYIAANNGAPLKEHEKSVP